jgi:dihydroorotate dehydrogenase electron transfer subunit
MTRQFNSTLRNNRQISEDYFELTLSWPEDLEKPLPGQFVSLKTINYQGSLLKRPFAVSAFSEKEHSFSMIIQRRGPATIGFSTMKIDSSINVTGPLGHAFPEPEQSSKPVLIGGGIGLGPVLYLSSHFMSQGLSPLLVLGYRSATFVPDLASKKLPETIICTDDGSEGFKGNVIDYLESKQYNACSDSTYYACGPDKMLEASEQFAQKNGHPIWISVEQTMACGIGACMGCVVPVHDDKKRFVRVCKEGPVFPGGYLKWT